MNIIPWRRREPMSPSLFDFEDTLSRMWGNGEEGFVDRLPQIFKSRPFPAVNVAETEDSFCVNMDCPGLEEKDLQVESMGTQLVISGERKWEEEKKGKEFRRVESQYGKFERTVQLPDNARVEPDEIHASYKKGILSITVPKVEKTPTSKIPVHAE